MVGERGRLLDACPLVLFIVYCTSADAAARGYEPWLRDVDNPFFNAIPGIRHYANWKISNGEVPGGFSHFDFLGLENDDDLERVWFNQDLDTFRRGWVAKWGYGPAPLEMHRYTYGMKALRMDAAGQADDGWLYGGVGPAPHGLGTFFEVTFSLAKHFASDPAERPMNWCLPAAERNPLNCTWVGLSEAAVPGLDTAPSTRFAYPATCIAKPS